MRNILKYFLKLFLFWMLLFLIQRIFFLLFQYDQLPGIGIINILLSGWYALPMDVSMTSYILLFPVLQFFILLVKDLKLIKGIILSYFIIIIILSAFINIVDLGLFEAWGSKLNNKALSYLAYPEEAIAATAATPIILLTGIFIIESIIAIWIFTKIRINFNPAMLTLFQKFILAILLLVLVFIGMRGGVQEIPINKSWSYYSKHPVLNLSAVNSTWNAIEIFIKPAEYETNPYSYLNEDMAEIIFKELHNVEQDTTVNIFNISKPNIILVLLESWSGDIIEAIGGEKDVTPEFARLSKQGLLFTNFYSTGFRTEQGLAALLSGFPSQPKTTIIRKFGKFDKLPSIVNVLDSNGYSSAYYYGGDLEFANTITYLKTAGFDKIIGDEDFEFIKSTEWGAYDEELFNFYLKDTKNVHEPFFHILMTSTSHEPFDAPVDGGFTGNTLPDRYRNTISYTDICLGNFLRAAKKQSWYPNTVFIITPDHGHFLPKNRNHYDAERHHIPFLIYGDALKEKFKGKIIDKFASHSDFASTVLSQLNISHDHFRWSKNLFNNYQEDFAFYSFDEGFGWLEKKQSLIFDHQFNDIISIRNDSLSDTVNNQILNKGKAYLQVLMEEYIGVSR